MRIELKTLNLENFKGIKKFTFAPGDKCLIRGANATGKTTLMDAFLWLLFGKDSQGKADFAMKTLRAGQEIPNLEHSVEGIFDIDGSALMLKKVLKEKYTKKRGASRADFTGHTTDFYIDEVPVQKKDWDQQIRDIIDEETFKLLTSPTYFNSIHWEKRRALLLEVCGNISDNDVISSDKALAVLPEILGNKSIEDQKKVIAAKRKEINQRLTEIPSRIDELDKSLADVSGYDIKAIQNQILELDKEIQAMRDDTINLNLRKQRAELQAKLSELENEKDRAYREATKEIDGKIDPLEKESRIKQAYITDSLSEISKKETTIKNNTNRMTQLREQYAEIVSRSVDVKDTCPTCGQPLPKDQVDKAIKKHNEQQAAHLVTINSEGKRLKNENNRLTGEIGDITKKGLTDEKGLKTLEGQIKELKDISINVPFDTSKIDKIKVEIQKIEKGLADNQPVNPASSEAERSTLQSQIAEVEATGKTRIRIEELKAEEKKLATEYEELERQISLLEKFTVAKVEMLEEKINSKFELARFKMFRTQINQGIEECCETLYEGVPYSTGLNSGAQILVGLDIVSTLQNHYGIKAPCWLDHREALTSTPKVDCQLISLAADERYKELKVENE
ncbi:MAG: AAA family ATPase [Candidatus Atribacteria bacterium]|nr:AAA family ATPase [Candidatus Atribacteria bacterium]